MQHFFTESSGATLLDTSLQANSSALVASAISWKSSKDNKNYIRMKVLILKLVYLEFM